MMKWMVLYHACALRSVLRICCRCWCRYYWVRDTALWTALRTAEVVFEGGRVPESEGYERFSRFLPDSFNLPCRLACVHLQKKMSRYCSPFDFGFPEVPGFNSNVFCWGGVSTLPFATSLGTVKWEELLSTMARQPPRQKSNASLGRFVWFSWLVERMIGSLKGTRITYSNVQTLIGSQFWFTSMICFIHFSVWYGRLRIDLARIDWGTSLVSVELVPKIQGLWWCSGEKVSQLIWIEDWYYHEFGMGNCRLDIRPLDG